MSDASTRRRQRRRGPPAAPPLPHHLVPLAFPAVLHHRIAGEDHVVGEGPLGLLAEALLSIAPNERNAFTISFAFPPRPEGQGE